MRVILTSVFVICISMPILATEKSDPNEKIANIETIAVQTIVEKANIVAYYQGQDGKAKVKMVITNKQGQKREREFNILRKDVEDNGDQKYFVYFQKPADVRRMTYLVLKHVDPKKDDDRWLYLPALSLTKRIAAGDKRTSFVGSHFFYEDDFTYKLLCLWNGFFRHLRLGRRKDLGEMVQTAYTELATMKGSVPEQSLRLSITSRLRSLYGSMVPKNRSAEFFGFYSLSAKFAGIFGPLVFGFVSQLVGHSRFSIVSVVIFFIVGAILLSKVDVEEGKRVARQAERDEESGEHVALSPRIPA